MKKRGKQLKPRPKNLKRRASVEGTTEYYEGIAKAVAAAEVAVQASEDIRLKRGPLWYRWHVGRKLNGANRYDTSGKLPNRQIIDQLEE